ncbi:helix-turn-helix transcriptional regulator [Trichocoleus sp. Lan]|uniref:helix-turn-helix transcriptional regulator n=1 Tax=Trichocoleus sp. Lan TaxID=2933927 RepID=UPI0032998F43
MERGIRASDEGREKVEETRKLKGWTQEYLAGASQCTRQTVNRFLAGQAIEKRIFQAICAELGMDWRAIADLPVSEQLGQQPTLDDLVETVRINPLLSLSGEASSKSVKLSRSQTGFKLIHCSN